LLLIFAIYT
jgi:hypothetical protein